MSRAGPSFKRSAQTVKQIWGPFWHWWSMLSGILNIVALVCGSALALLYYSAPPFANKEHGNPTVDQGGTPEGVAAPKILSAIEAARKQAQAEAGVVYTSPSEDISIGNGRDVLSFDPQLTPFLVNLGRPLVEVRGESAGQPVFIDGHRAGRTRLAFILGDELSHLLVVRTGANQSDSMQCRRTIQAASNEHLCLDCTRKGLTVCQE